MIFKSGVLKSSFLAVFLFVFLSASILIPRQVSAQGAVPVSDSALRTKEVGVTVFGYTVPGFSLDSILITATKIVIEKLVDSTVTWINSGFDGNPLYIKDSGKYFTNLADGVAGAFIEGSDLGFLCSPFQASIKLSLATEYSKERQFQCTLTDVIGNIDNFYEDFSQGGWEAWFAMTQTSVNNPYGAYLEASIEMDSRVASAVQEVVDDLNRGRGFISYRKCRGQMLPPEYASQSDTNGGCLGEWETVTPGSMIETQLSTVMGTGIRQLELADEFDEVVTALVGQLAQWVLGNKGLAEFDGVSSANTNPSGGLTGRLDIDGDGVADGIDIDGDGDLDMCFFGGVETPSYPPCRGSSDTSTPPYIPPENGSGGQCTVTGNVYANALMTAMNQTVEARPDLANAPNIEDSSGRKENARTFLRAVAEQLISNGYNATAEVLNGNNNPNTGDAIAVWTTENRMERYDAIVGGSGTVAQNLTTDFTGFIPLNCTISGGGGDCGCKSNTGTGPGEGVPLPLVNPPPIDTVNWSNVDWMDNDPSSWPVNDELYSVSISGRTINVPHSKAGKWPLAYPFGDSTTAEGTAWIFVYKNNRWKAATFDFLRPGQTSKGTDNITDACGALRGELSNFTPTAGQLYGFMITGIARSGYTNNIQERSNVVMQTWNGATGRSAPDACGGSTTPTPGTPGTPGGPSITSLSTTTVTPGNNLTINGSNLTSTVQFFGGDGARSTVTGTLSVNANQVSVIVPSDLKAGTGSVRVYKDANAVSNSKAITINSTGGSSLNIKFATPTKVVIPTGIDVIGYLGRTYQNGWWPSISPDGKSVSFGNWGDSFLLDLESESTAPQKNFEAPPGVTPGTNCLGGQWLSSTLLTFLCEGGSNEGYSRYEVNTNTLTPQKTSDVSANIESNIFRARDGHWASYVVRGGQGRIVKDGQLVGSNLGGAISVGGNTLVYACTNANTSICVRNGSNLRTYTARGDLHMTATDGSYVIYGGYRGGVRGITPTGQDVSLTLSPSGLEGPAEVVNVNGTRWVVSMAWGDNYTYILLRPWGSRSAIVLDAPAVHVSAVYKNGNFIVAYNDDVGNIKILTVPANAERHQF